MAAGDLPPTVATGELITSAWGNAVVAELLRKRNEGFASFGHAGGSGQNGTFDIGTTNLGPFAYPVVVTVWADYAFGFGTSVANWSFDIFKFNDNTVRATGSPIQSNINGAWFSTSLTWAWPVAAGANAGFKTRAIMSGATALQNFAASGIYHVQRTGSP